MRRKDKEITDFKAIEEIIKSSNVCRIAMSKDDFPYVVPMCFGYENNTLYLHSAKEGRKIDFLKFNPNVCIEFDADDEVIGSEDACVFGMKYKSVIASGKAVFLEDIHEKRTAVNILVRQYSDKSFIIPDEALKNMAVLKVDIQNISGKISGYKI